MSPEVAVLVRAALVALAVLGLEALLSARAQRAPRKTGRSPVMRTQASTQTRTHTPTPASPQHPAQTQSQSSAPVIVRLAPLPKAPPPHDEKRAA